MNRPTPWPPPPPHGTEAHDPNCPGCGAPIDPRATNCAYCRRPLVNDSPRKTFEHFTFRNGVRVRDKVVEFDAPGFVSVME